MTESMPKQPQTFPQLPHPYLFAMGGENEIDLIELGRTIWKRKLTIFIITFLFSLAAVTKVLMIPNIYKAEVLLAPTTSSNQGMMAGLMGKYGGLASLAGVDLGANQTDKTTLAIEILKSRAFITQFIKKYDLAIPLMAATSWDVQNEKWIVNANIYDSSAKKWVRKVKLPYKPEPSDLELYGIFHKKILHVDQDKQNRMVTISVSTMSPQESARWSALLVREINQKMREMDVREAEESLKYLKKQLKNTSLSELHQVFYELIEQQTKIKMLAEVRPEYVFKTIDPPVVPEKKDKPRRGLICIIAAVIGMSMGILYTLVSTALQNRNTGS